MDWTAGSLSSIAACKFAALYTVMDWTAGSLSSIAACKFAAINATVHKYHAVYAAAHEDVKQDLGR